MPCVRTTKKPMTSANAAEASTASGSVHHRLTAPASDDTSDSA
jgi:hypothetical protein